MNLKNMLTFYSLDCVSLLLFAKLPQQLQLRNCKDVNHTTGKMSNNSRSHNVSTNKTHCNREVPLSSSRRAVGIVNAQLFSHARALPQIDSRSRIVNWWQQQTSAIKHFP